MGASIRCVICMKKSYICWYCCFYTASLSKRSLYIQANLYEGIISATAAAAVLLQLLFYCCCRNCTAAAAAATVLLLLCLVYQNELW